VNVSLGSFSKILFIVHTTSTPKMSKSIGIKAAFKLLLDLCGRSPRAIPQRDVVRNMQRHGLKKTSIGWMLWLFIRKDLWKDQLPSTMTLLIACKGSPESKNAQVVWWRARDNSVMWERGPKHPAVAKASQESDTDSEPQSESKPAAAKASQESVSESDSDLYSYEKGGRVGANEKDKDSDAEEAMQALIDNDSSDSSSAKRKQPASSAEPEEPPAKKNKPAKDCLMEILREADLSDELSTCVSAATASVKFRNALDKDDIIEHVDPMLDQFNVLLNKGTLENVQRYIQVLDACLDVQ